MTVPVAPESYRPIGHRQRLPPATPDPARPRREHLITVVSLVDTIGLLLYACFQLRYPFGPATDLGPNAMDSALRLFG